MHWPGLATTSIYAELDYGKGARPSTTNLEMKQAERVGVEWTAD